MSETRGALPRPAPPPLSVYVHLPWCVRKCPYCDFNSHGTRGREIPEGPYVDALIRDLGFERASAAGRRVETVFFGGGTPSLFSARALERFLAHLAETFPLAPDAEITLEANPGTAEARRFSDYRALGINRLSLGVQSFDDRHLAALGRIHGAAEARAAIAMARDAGFENLNIDLMYGLPGQTAREALADLREAVSFEPAHISWYQLTIEPDTAFHRRPPRLPAEDDIWSMAEAGVALLADAGFGQYEVSAYARPARQCRHNRNYWEFGDYLGLGAGAHGKVSGAHGIVRRARERHPERYMAAAGTAAAVAEERLLDPEDLPFEFMLNAARLREGFDLHLFAARTGLPAEVLRVRLEAAVARGLAEIRDGRVRPTALGRRFLNDLVGEFLPGTAARAAAG